MISKTWVYVFTLELQPTAKQVETLTKNRPFLLNITASRPSKLTHLRTTALTPFLPSTQSCFFKILTTGVIAWISSNYFNRYHSLSNVWIDRPSMQSSDITTPWPLLGFMQKVTHDFQVANREISFGNVCMIQNCLNIFFDRSSYLTFKLSIACSTTLNQLHWIL